MRVPERRHASVRGFSLLEALIALATLLAYDITDRMRANRLALSSYVLTPPASSTSAPQDCEAATCTPAQLAAFDVSRWLAEMSARLPAAKGEITQSGSQFTIRVFWDDTRQGLTGTTCSGAATDMKCFTLVVEP